MSLFHGLIQRGEELDRLGAAYLEKLPFLTSQETAERLHIAAMRIFEAANREWYAVPDYVAMIADGVMPYFHPPRNGSLHFTLGFSVTSQEAHLRNLLEIAEGRESAFLDFPVVAELEVC